MRFSLKWPVLRSSRATSQPCGTSRRRGLRAWAADRLAARRRGTVAIEFAAIALPFLLLLLGTLETSLILFTGAAIDGAAREAAREIRVGATQQGADPVGLFRAKMCGSLFLVSCDDVLFDVRSFGSFAAISVPALYNAEGAPQSTQFSPGDAGEIVIVRASYRWAFQTPLMSHVFGSSDREVNATVVFRNEPFKIGS